MQRMERLIAALLCAFGVGGCGGGEGDTGGSTLQPVSPSAPSVSLSASPNGVAPGGSTQLTWVSSGASDCTASGAWSGAKLVSGSETINALSAVSTFSLTCTGTGGSTTQSVTVTVTVPGGSAGVSGAVDSSLLDRHQDSANRVYVFAGFNITTGTPVATVPVTQDVGACTFRYRLEGLSDGNYTVALTTNGGTSFRSSANVTVAGASMTQNFAPARIIRVGPGRTFKHPGQVTGLVSGDVIEVDAGVYADQETTWTTNNLTVRGVGGRAHLVAPATIANGKGIWVTQGANMIVENIEFSGAAVSNKNGAGIRADGRDMAICGSYFHDNENGILGLNTGNGNLLIEYSEFAHNGGCEPGFGCSHNMYIGNSDRFTLRYSYSHHANVGHLVKSRARENRILYNRLMDESDGSASYNIDLPNGGLSYIIGNLLQQGPNTDNPALIAYGAEGLTNPSSTFYVVNNTFVNDRAQGGTFVQVSAGGTAMATLRNNLFVGPGTVVSGGTVTQANNLTTNAPNFVSIGTFDYRPTSTTPGIDQGSAPGTAGTFDLVPAYQYVHPSKRELRPVRNAIDIGAYEFVP
ncbi:MAG: hypothetical protein LKCHEGNO_03235 [Burkholderiaceae bacterium]|nr:hypothetical protein [Burkholderiaceae bacterium]